MFGTRTLSFVFMTMTMVAAAVDDNEASPQQHQLLRRVMDDVPDHGRQLQIFQNLLDPCRFISNQFPAGKVACDCNVALATAQVDYTCTWSEPVCAGPALCGTPVYSGTLNVLQATLANEICLQDVTAVGDLVALGDFCVNLAINPRSEQVVTCSATLGAASCDSCLPCPDGSGGVLLNCLNLIDNGTGTNCTNIRTVTRLNSKKKITTPFVPNF